MNPPAFTPRSSLPGQPSQGGRIATPANPKIYHIVHYDRLASIIGLNGLLCDATMVQHGGTGTVIGMDHIKRRRLEACMLSSHFDLYVGQCVPFYFCPRSVMLYAIDVRNAGLAYQGGQVPIVHLEADLRQAVAHAEAHGRRWAFTLGNAGSLYFEDRANLDDLYEINWAAVQARTWGGLGVDPALKEGKQAEFLMEGSFPWRLVQRIGVSTPAMQHQVSRILALQGQAHRPQIEVKPDWYY